MTLGELIAAARLRLDDCSESRMVSDAAWTDYFNEAEAQAATRSLLLFDEDTPAVCRLALRPGVSHYALDPRLLVLTRAHLPDIRRTLFQFTHGETPIIEASTSTGDPVLFRQQEHFIKVYPTPERAITLHLAGYRLPLNALESTDDEPEIAGKDHLPLVHWACHKAFMSLDIEVFNEQGAMRELALFEQRFGRARSSNDIRIWREYPGILRARPQMF